MRRTVVIVGVAMAVGLVQGCGDGAGGSSAPSPTAGRRLTVSSPAFAEGGTIPRRHTCDGENVSPPLAFSGLPPATVTLALLVQDPDAPHGPFPHGLLWTAPPGRTGWPAGQVPRGTVQGRNGFKKNAYGGPCPPKGKPHHYVFSVYATDKALTLSADATADDVRRALTGHTAASGTLTGRYGR